MDKVVYEGLVSNLSHIWTKSFLFQSSGAYDYPPQNRNRQIQYWLKKRKIRAFYNDVVSQTFVVGCKALLQLAGLGKLRANIAAFGFKTDWKQCPPVELIEHFLLLQ